MTTSRDDSRPLTMAPAESIEEGSCGKSVQNINLSCPFSSKHGYATKSVRQEYLEQNHLASHDVPADMEADMDISKPLYFWQIHSLTGQEPLFSICSDFYDFVREDEDAPWFKRVFERTAPWNHHILAQAAYWIDAMGGGRLYMGGHGRLNFHHQHNADSIMNAKGARQWMYYMRLSLKKNRRSFDGDPRILPAIMDFLKTKMRSYAKLHNWDFDDGDYDISSSWEERTVPNLDIR